MFNKDIEILYLAEICKYMNTPHFRTDLTKRGSRGGAYRKKKKKRKEKKEKEKEKERKKERLIAIMLCDFSSQ